MRICFLNQAPKKSAAYEAARIEAQLNSYASPGTKVEIVFPDDYEGSQLYDTIGSQSILNGLHHMMETPAIVRKIFWAAENGYDAVISSNTFDPGVDGGRLAVNIPVIGLMRTSMHAALTLADRVGITVPHARAGKVRMLAVTGPRRLPFLPDVPTIAESGLPGYSYQAWFGLAVPAGTHRDIVSRLNAETVKVAGSAESREWQATQGQVPASDTPEEFAALIKADYEKWGQVIREAGIKLE